MLTLLVISWLITALGSTLIPENTIQSRVTAPKNIVAFYNINSKRSDDGIVENQIKTLKSSGLLDELDNVYYVTMGSAEKTYDIDSSEKYVHIAHYGDSGSELQTLNLLHQFCNANPSSRVLYFHDQIRFSQSRSNDTTVNLNRNGEFSDLLNCYVLNKHCISALDSHDTCGWRISPTPQTHYSGNFWWARCEYVNVLIDPLAPLNNQTFVEATKSLNQKCVGTDKNTFAETWIGTGTILLPADCMNGIADHSYVWGSGAPPKAAAAAVCHGPDQPSGHPCQTASTFDHVHVFKKAIDDTNALIPEECRDNRKDITKLSKIMYGEEPHTYLEWMDRHFNTVPLLEGKLIRFSDSQVVYIAQSGELRGVPNLKTFMALGRDFSEVNVLHANERHRYIVGASLPSA